ncbi:MAG: hypothetical protein OXU61_12520 [Gammaproteobacteria bacterium]|nr:hypothetical protein [Gammaproteobacteria bacterium]
MRRSSRGESGFAKRCKSIYEARLPDELAHSGFCRKPNPYYSAMQCHETSRFPG